MRLFLVVLLAVAVAACSKPQPAQKAAETAPAPAAPAGAPGGGLTGKVLEKLEAAPYTYLKLSTPQGETWAAVPQTDVAVGSQVTVASPMPMDGFESKTLNRKFDKLVFGTLGGGPGAGGPGAGAPAGSAPAGMGAAPKDDTHASANANSPANMAAQHAVAAAGPTDVGSVKVEKAKGADARTVSEIFAQKGSLKEKPVTVRGKVVKFSAGIMGRNWVHLRDGSGDQAKGDNDITITTGDTAAVGDVVLVKGTVRLDKDFGAGYAYPVIVEDAKISK